MTDYSELDREQLIERLQLLEQGSKGEATCTPNDLERVQAEQALRASEAHLASVLRAAPVGIGVLQQRVFQDVNETMTVLTGYSREELLGQSARMLYASDADYEHVGIEKYRRIREQGVGSVETRWRCKDGKIINVFLSSTPITPGELTGKVVFTAENITERKQADAERMAAMERQRDTLVREVHHRIKNHLQGVSGMLRGMVSDYPESAIPLGRAIEKVRAIAQVYGLQSSRDDARVRLCDLVRTSAENMIGAVSIVCNLPPAGTEIILIPEEAVPLALIVNELLTNALKHIESVDQQRPVMVAVSISEQAGCVEIRGGPAHLAPGFDFVRQKGIGTGLELVAALLPPQGSRLEFRQEADEVVARLVLESPVISAINRPA